MCCTVRPKCTQVRFRAVEGTLSRNKVCVTFFVTTPATDGNPQGEILYYYKNTIEQVLVFFTFQETDYACIITMGSGEFARICRDLSQFGESVTISCTKEGVQFGTSGDIGTG